MIYRRINQAAHPLAVVLCFLLLVQAGSGLAHAKDNWISVRSRNFFLIGDASEKDIRLVATQLEKFRDVFSRVLGGMKINSPVPTMVIVFKNDRSYKPFKIGASVAGYFQPGEEVNYITLTSERIGADEDKFRVIFHEYVHLLVDNTIANTPAWYNEGLAEYYSTFMLADDRRVVLGRVIPSHVLFLREQELMPLRTLFAVDHSSPYYNEKNKANVFYAQSWAVVHYLIVGNKGQRRSQMGRFLDLVVAGKAVEAAFNEAFQISYETLEKELEEYIKRDTYPAETVTFEKKLEFESGMQSAPITEAQVQAYMGDLLRHSGRVEAEDYLQAALRLDPQLGMANASLGLLRARAGRFEESRQFLEKALAVNTQNYLAHYYYAVALSRQGMVGNDAVHSYPPALIESMRARLMKAIDLRPDFAESYHLLAFINLVVGEQLDESIVLLRRAIALSPGKQEYPIALAQIYMRKAELAPARQLLEPIARDSGEPEVRQHAQGLLNQIRFMEAEKTRLAAGKSAPGVVADAEAPGDRQDPEQVTIDPLSGLGDALRKPHSGETRTQALLVRIDCNPRGIVFNLREGEKLLKLGARDYFNGIAITTYTSEVKGEITCGQRKVAPSVVVTYRPAKDAKALGQLVALEFVPSDFKLQQ